MELINLYIEDDYESYIVKTENCEYIVYFLKEKGLTSWISIPRNKEVKEEIQSILGKIKEFRSKELNQLINV